MTNTHGHRVSLVAGQVRYKDFVIKSNPASRSLLRAMETTHCDLLEVQWDFEYAAVLRPDRLLKNCPSLEVSVIGPRPLLICIIEARILMSIECRQLLEHTQRIRPPMEKHIIALKTPLRSSIARSRIRIAYSDENVSFKESRLKTFL